MDRSANLLSCHEACDLLDHAFLEKLLRWSCKKVVEKYLLREVSLLRCQFNETFGVGEVTTCAHSEIGQLLFNLIRLGVRAESCLEHGGQCACSLAWDEVLDLIEVVTHCWSTKGRHHPA